MIKKHGHDTYGDDEDSDTAELKPKEKKKSKKGQKMEGQCKCGSKTHLRTSHKQCPYNSRRLKNAPTPPHIDDDASPPDRCYEDDIIRSDMCICGALGRAHKPMSSSSFPTEVYSTDCRLSQSDSVWEAVAKPKPNLSKSGKRKRQEEDKHPVLKKQRVTTSSFEVGNYVCLHSSRLVNQHVPCRIVRKSMKGYQLYCRKGILSTTYPSDELTSLDGNRCITLDAWHQASKISFKSVINDSSCMEVCHCVLSKSAKNVIELTSSDDETSTGITMWVHNAVYSDKQ